MPRPNFLFEYCYLRQRLSFTTNFVTKIGLDYVGVTRICIHL